MSDRPTGIRRPTPGPCGPGRTASRKTYRGRFLFFGTGYYNYDSPYSPEFPGIEDFAGEVAHPQHWPESLDYAGKRVVVIGSGATAISLIPIAGGEGLRTSPCCSARRSYIFSYRRSNRLVNTIRKVLPRKIAHPIVRWRYVLFYARMYVIARKAPNFFEVAAPAPTPSATCPRAIDVDTHFKPRLQPVGPAVVRDPGLRLVQRSSARAASMW